MSSSDNDIQKPPSTFERLLIILLAALKYWIFGLLLVLASLMAGVTGWYLAPHDTGTKTGFHAYLSVDQKGIPDGIWTKVHYNTVVFDPLGDFDGGTNHRYNPSVAGKYLIGVTIQATALGKGKLLSAAVYKNNDAVAWVSNGTSLDGNQTMTQVVTLQEMNGRNDFVEGYAWHNNGEKIGVVGNPKIQFWAVKLSD